MKHGKTYTINFITRILFLLITPTVFRALNFAFIWHSVYWGTVTTVAVVWGLLIIISPVFGRIGCGWICFMGTVQDLTGQYSVCHIRHHRPVIWIRVLIIFLFFASAIVFFIVRLSSGKLSGVQIDLSFFDMDFTGHYKHIWLYDVTGAIMLGLLLERRWGCRNLCPVGSLCAAGATMSRILPVIDPRKCNHCGRCEADCLVRIPVTDYIKNNYGLVTDPDCIICGRCIDSCNRDAIRIRFVLNRKKYFRKYSTSYQSPRVSDANQILSGLGGDG